jgi:hypothetical protein
MGDLLTDYERSTNRDWQSDRDTNGITNPTSSSSFTKVDASTTGGDEAREEHHESKEKELCVVVVVSLVLRLMWFLQPANTVGHSGRTS